MVKNLLAVVVTCAVLRSSVVEMFDFNYCCLDCIPTSNTHIACARELPSPPPECKSFAQIYGPDFEDEATTKESLPNSTMTSVVDSTTTDSSTHNDTFHYYRFKRQSDNSFLDDIVQNHINEDDMLDAVNEIRRNWVTNATVANMEEMAYDEELGDLAEVAARMCNSVKHYCADTPAFEVQILKYNVTLRKDYNITVTNAIDLWTKGRQELLNRAKTDNIYRESDERHGSFVTLIWADTSRMGCADAINTMVNPKTGINEMTYQITCLFGPKGNKIGKAMWVKGEPCASCPPGTLCGPYGLMCTRAEPENLPLDPLRTSRCQQFNNDDLNPFDEGRLAKDLGRFKDFNTGVKVVIRPRRICDPIPISTGRRAINQFWIIAACFLLAHSNKWIESTHIKR